MQLGSYFTNTSTMAGIKRKSAAAVQPEVKSKSKKVKTDKPAKRSSDKNADKPTKSSKKSKRKDDSDDLMESDTSEVENGFYGFSASKGEVEDVSMGDEADDGFLGEELEAALDNDTAKEKKKSKKDKDGKSEHKKDKKASKETGAAEEKSSTLAGLNGKRCRPLKCLRADTMLSQFFARGSRQAEGACKRAQSCQT